MTDKLFLNYRKVLLSVLAVDVLLIFLHLVWGREVAFVNLDLEYNLPAIYSGFKLILVGSLAFSVFFIAYLAKTNGLFSWPWLVLGLMFIYLGVDEMSELHERLGNFFATRGLADLGWFQNPTFYWVLLFSPLILLALVFLGFFIKRLLSTFRLAGRFFLLGLMCYVFVIVLEVVGGFLGHVPLGYHLMTLEESFEILGTTMFLGGILEYISHANLGNETQS